MRETPGDVCPCGGYLGADIRRCHGWAAAGSASARGAGCGGALAGANRPRLVDTLPGRRSSPVRTRVVAARTATVPARAPWVAGAGHGFLGCAAEPGPSAAVGGDTRQLGIGTGTRTRAASHG